ncbi:MAG: malto-oligosyltrehalose synthase [Pseudomonadota bacterium]
MNAPIRATYRVQLRCGVGFSDVAALAPHLAAANISHLYLSPPFTAVSGSTHGYDVTDPAAFDPSLGGAGGFAAMSEALHSAGVRLMVDIVPNHMAAHPQNPWWWDVLRLGRGSAFARHFDIDWAAGPLTLPILGAPLGALIAAGEVSRGTDEDGAPTICVPNHSVPMAPGTEHIDDLSECLAAQHYRLVYWRYGRDSLNYRRFFEINELSGLRVEDPAVFDDVHRLVLAEVSAGRIDALRIDHVDGLADPLAYMERLAAAAPIPVVAEKIAEPDEDLSDWPVLGTTGYELIAGLAGLFVDRAGFETLKEGYAATANDGPANPVVSAKLRIITFHLASELSALLSLAKTAFQTVPAAGDYGDDTLRRAITGLLCAMPVYRTYGARGTLSAADATFLKDARANVPASELIIEDEGPLDQLVALFSRDDPQACDFVTRFQQTSGPVMAKAIEDTLFYRQLTLLGLNEVGGALTPDFGPSRLVNALSEYGLAATQTHDNKRGEDARARLYALSDPAAATLWADVWPTLGGEELPAKWRWGLAQMAFASRPLHRTDDYADRLAGAALKSVREAKEDTGWTATNPAFEQQILDHARALAAKPFDELRDVVRAGAVISLGQALLKGMGRRAPDIYQGTFGWDLSMVDPDNRRPVDFEIEAALCDAAKYADLQQLKDHWTTGAAKARVLLTVLALRAERPELFTAGTISQPAIEGPLAQAAATLAIGDGASSAVAVVLTRPLGFLAKGLAVCPPNGAMTLGYASTERLSGTVCSAGAIDLAEHLTRFPVALFAS